MTVNRIDEIRSLLLARKEISVQQLCSLYKVSAVSIRKDLRRLEEEGFLQRVYGGAVLAGQGEVSAKTSELCIDNRCV